MVSVVIPAFNEEKTVEAAISAAKSHPDVGEVIVVDDASRDKTAAIAEKLGVKVIRLPHNLGKAGAMGQGVRATKYDVILFLDADRSGFTNEKISRIINPVLSGQYEMYVGIRAQKIYWLNYFLHYFPIIGGERAITKALWHSIPENNKQRFQIEIAMNYFAKKTSRGMGFELIEGTKHIPKEKKLGIFRGLWQRIKMIGDIANISFQLYILKTTTEVAGRLVDNLLVRGPERYPSILEKDGSKLDDPDR